MLIIIIALFLTSAFWLFLWHLDINHNLDKLGKKRARGIFKISPETGYRVSQYGLITVVLLFNLLILYLLLVK